MAGLHKNTILMSTMIKGYVAQRDLTKALAMKDRMLLDKARPKDLGEGLAWLGVAIDYTPQGSYRKSCTLVAHTPNIS